jgi:hypothetical protein
MEERKMDFEIGDRVYVMSINQTGNVVGEEKDGQVIVDTEVGNPIRGQIEVDVDKVRLPSRVPFDDIESIGGL